MSGRQDMALYYNGCSTMSNVVPLATGGFLVRSGSEFIAKAKGACRLIAFEFSAADTMILEMGNLYIRFYKDDDRVMTASVEIDDITLASGAEVSVEAGTHGRATGDVVRFSDVGGTTELNYTGVNTEFTITRTDADNFTLDDTDGDDFTAWTSEGTVAAIYELTSPYSATEVFELMIARSGDIFKIDHEDYEPRQLTRVSDNSWTIGAITFTDGPFLAGNTTGGYTLQTNKGGAGTHTGAANQAVLTDSAAQWVADALIGYIIYNVTDGSSTTITDNTATTVTGTLAGGTENDWDTNDVYYIWRKYYIIAGTTGLTLTVVGGTPFVADHVGTKFLLEHSRADATTTTAAEVLQIKGDFSLECENFTAGVNTVTLFRKVGNLDWQIFQAFHSATTYTDTEEEDDAQYYFTLTGANVRATLTADNQIHRSIVEATHYLSTTTMTVTAITNVYFEYDEADNKTTDWAIGAWGENTGYPRAVTFHEDRVLHGGTANNPQTIWGSKTGDYDNMTPGTNDDDAITLAINDVDVSEIEWLASFKSLVVGTANKEYMIAAADQRDPITPDDSKSSIQSAHGSSHIQPVALENALFHVQAPGRKMRYMQWNEYGDRLVSTDATKYSQHLFELSPVSMAVQRSPESVLWAVRNDGTLCLYVFDPAEEVSGWCRFVTGSLLDSPVDKYTSVAVVSGSVEDDVWVSVNRTIESTSVYYIEKFAVRYIEQLDEAMMLDSAKVVVGANDAKDIIVASDTVRYGEGIYGSGPYGGTL